MTHAPDGTGAERNPDAAGDEPAASHVSASSAPERIVDTQVIHRGRYLEFRIHAIERADGSRSEREVVGHPGAVALVAIDDDERILFVRQYRLAAATALLELPAGTLDVDAATGEVEAPDLAAARELEEETGHRAGRFERIAQFWTAPGFATELMTVYIATGLRPADEHDRLAADEDELLEMERLSLDEALAAIDAGEIRDAKSIVGVLLYARRH